MNIKLDASKLLGIGTIALGVVSTILAGVKENNDKKVLKSEITDEVLKNLKTKE